MSHSSFAYAAADLRWRAPCAAEVIETSFPLVFLDSPATEEMLDKFDSFYPVFKDGELWAIICKELKP